MANELEELTKVRDNLGPIVLDFDSIWIVFERRVGMKKIIINFLKLAVYIFVILDTFFFNFITNEIIKNIFMVIAILCVIYDIWDSYKIIPKNKKK